MKGAASEAGSRGLPSCGGSMVQDTGSFHLSTSLFCCVISFPSVSSGARWLLDSSHHVIFQASGKRKEGEDFLSREIPWKHQTSLLLPPLEPPSAPCLEPSPVATVLCVAAGRCRFSALCCLK